VAPRPLSGGCRAANEQSRNWFRLIGANSESPGKSTCPRRARGPRVRPQDGRH
jgi:hypothetical protein